MKYALRDVYAIVGGVRTLVAVKGQPVQDHFAQFVDADELTDNQAQAIASTLEPAELPGQDLASSMSARRVTPEDSEPVTDPTAVVPPAPPSGLVPPADDVKFYDADADAEARMLGITAEQCTPDVDGDITEEEVRQAFFATVTDREGLLAKARELGVEDLEDVGDDEMLSTAIVDRLEELTVGELVQLAGPLGGEVTDPTGTTVVAPKPFSEMDKAELVAELERRNIAFSKRAKNADLVKLLEEHPAE